MYDDKTGEWIDGNWVTIHGHRVFIRTKGAKLKEKTILSLNPRAVGDKRMQQLREKYPNATYENQDGVEKLFFADESLKEDETNWEFPSAGRGNYKDTTQQQLNNMPIAMNFYWTDDWSGQSRQSHYIYRDKAQMMKDIKMYGGMNELTDNGRIKYTITSESGLGEYYLMRDKMYKGGWVWEDSNVMKVKGYEFADFGKIREKKAHLHDKELIEKWGVEKYKDLFGERAYERYLENEEKYKGGK